MEFALVLPLVALVAIGLVQVARITALQVATVDAARAGARAAAVDPRESVAEAAARKGAHGSPRVVDMRLTGSSPRSVTVEVTEDVAVMPLFGWMTVQLHASSTMAVEHAE